MLFVPVFSCGNIVSWLYLMCGCGWQGSCSWIIPGRWLKAVYILGRLWQIVEDGGSQVRDATRNWNCLVFHPISASTDGSPPSHQGASRVETTVVAAAKAPAREGEGAIAAAVTLARQDIQTLVYLSLFRLGVAPFLFGFWRGCQIHHQVVGSWCNSGTLFVHLIGWNAHPKQVMGKTMQQKWLIGNRSEMVRCYDHQCETNPMLNHPNINKQKFQTKVFKFSGTSLHIGKSQYSSLLPKSWWVKRILQWKAGGGRPGRSFCPSQEIQNCGPVVMKIFSQFV